MATRSCGRIAAVLFCSAVAWPCIAADAQPLTASPAFRTAAEQVRSVLASGDLRAADAQLSSMTPASPLETYIAGSLAMELAVKRNDLVAQRTAVTRMLESSGAPEAELPRLNHVAGYLAARAGATENAIAYLSRARTLGISDPRASLLLVESYVRLRRMDDAARVLGETIAARRQAMQPVPASWYDRSASLALVRRDWAGLASASAGKLADPSMTGPDWRSAIVTYLANAQPEKDAALDLYRLQSAAGALASERDWQAYAAAAVESGNAAEAGAVIAAGQASGALAKADPVVASLQRSVRAVRSPSAKTPANAPNLTGAQAAEAGDDLLGAGRFADAAAYYRAALAKGADRDRVTTRLGIALARAGDLDGARAALAQAQGRWAEVAAFWTAWAEARRPRAATTVPPIG